VGLREAIALVLMALVAWAVRLADAPPLADLVFVVLLGIDAALTTAGVMARLDVQDTFGHVVLPAAIAPIVLAAGQPTRLFGRLAARGPVALTAAVAGTVFMLGVAWEICEALADAVLGSNMSIDRADTIHDLVCDAIGATFGAILAVALSRNPPQLRPAPGRIRSDSRPPA
jgi:hypothetical protein